MALESEAEVPRRLLLLIGLVGALGASGCKHHPLRWERSYGDASHKEIAAAADDPPAQPTVAPNAMAPSDAGAGGVAPRASSPQTGNVAPILPVTPAMPTGLPKPPRFEALPPPIFPGEGPGGAGAKALVYEEIANAAPTPLTPSAPARPAATQIITILPNGDAARELNSKAVVIREGTASSTLCGEVQQFRHTWRLRYAPPDADDPHGGSVCLEGAGLDRLQDGQRVRVTGTQIPGADRFVAPRFQVEGLEMVNP